MRCSTPCAIALSLCMATAAHAAGPLLFEHGARAIAEAGAFDARAEDAVAISYNPAAAAHLQGSHYQIGFDFGAPQDRYRSATLGEIEAGHVIAEAPAFYGVWHLPQDYYPWSFGFGVDRASNYLMKWDDTALFPGRFLNSWQRLDLWVIHPVIAYELGSRWGVGAGIKYYTGSVEQGNDSVVQVRGTGGQLFGIEAERLASATGTGTSIDFGLHYQAHAFAWTLAGETGGKVSGGGHVDYTPRDVSFTDGVLQANVKDLLRRGSSHLGFDLPPQARMGFLFGGGAWKLEVDGEWAQWSHLGSTSVSYDPDPFAVAAGLPAGTTTETTRRDWKDTLSLRMGIEWNVNRHFDAAFGVGSEPSPIPSDRIEPGFPRGGDAMVYGAGFGYRTSRVRFDIAYSFHQYASTQVQGQELLNPTRPGTYSGKDQVFGLSASWHH